jgi:hypothetical protein
MVNMNRLEIQQLEEHLVGNGFNYTDNCGSTMYFEKIHGEYTWYIALTEPHSGNKYKWMLRAEREDNFDRWSNADYQEFYDTVSSFKSDAVNKLNTYIEGFPYDDEFLYGEETDEKN